MHAKMITLGIIMVLILVTVILQMAVFGNDEEMAEEEYEEYQIRIDLDKMTKGILSLFNGNTRPSGTYLLTEEEQENRQTDEDTSMMTIQPMPTMKTLPTLILYGEGTKDGKDAE